MSKQRTREYDLSKGILAFHPSENYGIFKQLIYIFLGWFAITLEVFLRKNFGERYLSRSNLWIGLFLLTIFTFFGKFSLGWFSLRLGGGMFYYIWYGYVLMSIVHLIKIWVNSQVGNRIHSLYNGESRLLWIGKFIIKGLNPIIIFVISNAARLILSKKEHQNLVESFKVSPPIKDAEKFTKQFIEPTVVMFCAYRFTTGALFTWLLFCGFALSMHTNMSYDELRKDYLDMMDSMLEAMGKRTDATYNETMQQNLTKLKKEVQQKAKERPEIYDNLRAKSPSVADAITQMEEETALG